MRNRYISTLLDDRRFSGHPFEVLGGLDWVARGAEMLRENKVSSKKLVYRFVFSPRLGKRDTTNLIFLELLIHPISDKLSV